MSQQKKISSRKTNRKEALIEAAADLFKEKGYEKTTIDDITSRAETSHGTFYTYFSSKEDVLEGFGRALLEKLTGYCNEIKDRRDLIAPERFRLIIKKLLNIHEKGNFKMNLHDAIHRRLHDSLSEEGRRQFIPLLCSIIEEGVEQGFFHIMYPYETTVFLSYLVVELEHNDEFIKTEEQRKRSDEALRELLTRTLGCDAALFSETFFER